MIVPGLEASLGYAHQDMDDSDDNINQFNTWLAYNPGDLTLALEFDISMLIMMQILGSYVLVTTNSSIGLVQPSDILMKMVTMFY